MFIIVVLAFCLCYVVYGSEELVKAAEFGNTAEVVRLLEEGANIDYRDDEEITPLMMASSRGMLETVKKLVELGAKVDLTDEEGNSAVFYALMHGYAEVAEILFKRKSKLYKNRANNDGMTLMHLCCSKDSPAYAEFTRRILQKRVFTKVFKNSSLNSKYSVTQETPLHVALQSGSKESAQMLIRAGVDVISETGEVGKRPLHLAAVRDGFTDVVEELIKKGVPLDVRDSYGDTALHLALRNGPRETVLALLKAGADKSAAGFEGCNILRFACFRSDLKDVAAELIRNRQGDLEGVQDYGGTTLHQVLLRECDKDIVDLLVDAIKDVDAVGIGGMRPLHLAACRKDLFDVVKKLIGRKVKLSEKDKEGSTPLYLALKYGSKESAMLLIESGAEVDLAGPKGYRPLHLAARRKDASDIVDVLIRKNVELDATNDIFNTALHEALRSGCKQSVELLINAGASVYVAGAEDMTPLHLVACRSDLSDVLNTLIDKNVELNTRDQHGSSALLEALKYGHKATALRLMDAGAEIAAIETSGYTALHFVSSYPDMADVLEMLLKSGLNPNVCNNEGVTPAHVAFESKENLKLLAKYGADFNISNKNGVNSLMMVILNDNGPDDVEMAEILFECGARMPKNRAPTHTILSSVSSLTSFTTLHGILMKPMMAAYLINEHPDIDYDLLLYVLVDNSIENRGMILATLINNGAKVKEEEGTTTLNLFAPHVLEELRTKHGDSIQNNVEYKGEILPGEDFRAFVRERVRIYIENMGEMTIGTFIRSETYALYVILKKIYRNGKNVIEYEEEIAKYEDSIQNRRFRMYDEILQLGATRTYMRELPMEMISDAFQFARRSFRMELNRLSWIFALVEDVYPRSIAGENGYFLSPEAILHFLSCKKL